MWFHTALVASESVRVNVASTSPLAFCDNQREEGIGEQGVGSRGSEGLE